MSMPDKAHDLQTPSGPPSSTHTTDTTEQRPSTPVGRLASVLRAAQLAPSHAGPLSTGEMAAIARVDPEGPRPHQIAALAKAFVTAGLDPSTWKPVTWRRWTVIAQGIALAGHDGQHRLGQQLGRAGIAESRITKLLTARGDAFFQLLPRLIRLAASHQVALNWHELSTLVLHGDDGNGADSELAEQTRLRIAASYYAAQAAQAR